MFTIDSLVLVPSQAHSRDSGLHKQIAEPFLLMTPAVKVREEKKHTGKNKIFFPYEP